MQNNMVIKRNAIRCKHCGDVIESKYTHDFVTCSCGLVSVDGGHSYLKRSCPTAPEIDYEDLSVCVERPLARPETSEQ